MKGFKLQFEGVLRESKVEWVSAFKRIIVENQRQMVMTVLNRYSKMFSKVSNSRRVMAVMERYKGFCSIVE